MSSTKQWSDLGPRVLSGLVLAVAGAFVVWQGGWVFQAAVALAAGLMTWEAARMFGAKMPVGLGVLAAVILLFSSVLPGFYALPLLLAVGIVAAGNTSRDAQVLLVLVVWLMLAIYGLVHLRQKAGAVWVLWLVMVVITSDISGYFVGRAVGGPKFLPSVSPKKTWSGTVAGWIGGGVIGALFTGPTGTGVLFVIISVLVAFAAQLGDIAESAAKRRAGVKDSSNLIPGHGGVFDRFDALLGGATAVLLLWLTGVGANTG